MPEATFRTLTDDAFEAEFRPIMRDGSWAHYDWHRTPDAERIEQARRAGRLWTLVDGSGSHCTLLSGFHVVNRLAYVITAKPVPAGAEIEVPL